MKSPNVQMDRLLTPTGKGRWGDTRGRRRTYRGHSFRPSAPSMYTPVGRPTGRSGGNGREGGISVSRAQGDGGYGDESSVNTIWSRRCDHSHDP